MRLWFSPGYRNKYINLIKFWFLAGINLCPVFYLNCENKKIELVDFTTDTPLVDFSERRKKVKK